MYCGTTTGAYMVAMEHITIPDEPSAVPTYGPDQPDSMPADIDLGNTTLSL